MQQINKWQIYLIGGAIVFGVGFIYVFPSLGDIHLAAGYAIAALIGAGVAVFGFVQYLKSPEALAAKMRKAKQRAKKKARKEVVALSTSGPGVIDPTLKKRVKKEKEAGPSFLQKLFKGKGKKEKQTKPDARALEAIQQIESSEEPSELVAPDEIFEDLNIPEPAGSDEEPLKLEPLSEDGGSES